MLFPSNCGSRVKHEGVGAPSAYASSCPLAEEDDARGHGRILVERVAAPLRYAMTPRRLPTGGWYSVVARNWPPAEGISRGGWRLGGLNRASHHGSCQLIQQRLGLLQNRHIEAFSEPAIDR